MIICGELQMVFSVGSIMGEMHLSAYQLFGHCEDLAITCAFVASWIIQGKA
eukprot:CAMPEP_0197328324 /NCGR_PEP_ID=MMETSP0892-20130614/4402_1 /TAXON_ID=44058 ORGANISM="Aureoumbra lagunensis, Strain CCMP1510" /NCGR_SAMPLE_ID=MMETSP0892 /ASSEMBLY_ACC=CAM_ASM_000538 /LENGTH=50 /DNA_ID=CAMNT_0042824131 /DNA_START=24 /DNA_END=173 /DNA_ORIENTATION=-